MGSKVLAWFKELPPLHKAATGGGAGLVGALALILLWGRNVLFLAIGIGLVVALLITSLHFVFRKRASGQGKSFSQELLKHIKKAKSEIGEQFERALAELKTNHVDIYNLPWFFFVGEPQSGKTFTIKSSGVDLPIGTEGISGAGGTRDCDFWFTSEAVILDTAGRLTVQQDEVIDRQQWNEVLRLLKRFRPNCPINGALLCIPCTSLFEDDLPTREKKAEVIRNRLKEIQKELGIHFPIFLMMTKVDLVLGFEPFFKRLPVLERKQLLGWSNDARFDQPFNPATFGKAFDAVSEDLHRWRLKLLNDEDSPDAIDQYYVFPEEFRALKQPIADYLNKIFLTKPYIQPGFFRGFYFTSSLQEGRAIPQAIQSILGGIGDADQRSSSNLQEVQARSSPFFVRDVYTRKVFPEKGLVLRSDRSKLMNAVVRGTAVWGGGAVLGLILLLLAFSVFQVGNELKSPRDMVVAIQEEKDTPERCVVDKDDKVTLTIDGALGSTIQSWERGEESSSWFRRLLRPVFRSAAQDPEMLHDLKTAYRHHFQRRHLIPFFNAVLGLLREMPRESNWPEFKARSENILRLAELMAGSSAVAALDPTADPRRSAAERFRGLGDLYRAGPSPSRALANLQLEFERYLALDGQPSSLRGELSTLWPDLEKSAAKVQDLLSTILDAAPFAPGGEAAAPDFGKRYQDGLLWWRDLLWKCQQVDKAYQGLLKLVQGASEQDYRDPSFFADPVAFKEQLQKPWDGGYKAFQAAWEALKGHLDGAGADENLRERLAGQRAAIDKFYSDLLAAVNGLKGSEAKALVEKLDQERMEVARSAERFDKALTDRFRGLSYLIDFKVPTAPGAEGAAAAAGGRASLAAYGNDVHAALAGLNSLLARDSSALVKSLEPLRRSGMRGFGEALEKQYLAEKNLVEAVKLAPPPKVETPAGAAASPPPEVWSRRGLDALMTAGRAGKFTDTIREILDAYLGWGGAMTGPSGETLPYPAMDLWFFDAASMKPLGADTLYGVELNGPYREECIKALGEHLQSVKAFLKKYENDRQVLLLKVPEYQNGIDERFSAYKVRYLNYWKAQAESLSPGGDPADWLAFKAELKKGFKLQSSAGVLFNKLTASIKLVAEQVAGVDDAVPWVASVKKYDKTTIGGLLGMLNDFAKFVDGLPDDPVKAMAMVRNKDKKSSWLAGFPAMVEGLFGKDQEAIAADLFARKILKLSETGKELLLDGVKGAFKKEWSQLVETRGEEMNGKFPFIGEPTTELRDNCPLLRGEPETQVQSSQLKGLLGKKGALTQIWERYDGCLVAEDAGPEDRYGLQLGKAYLDFLKAAKSLRALVFEENGDRYRQIKFKVTNPKEEFKDLKVILTASENGVGIYRYFPNCEFTINRGLTGQSPYRFMGNDMGKESGELSWRPPDEKLESGKMPKAGFYVTNPVAPGAPYKVDLKMRLKAEDVGCDGERGREVDDLELKFEAQGFWSFILLLEVYGAALDDGFNLMDSQRKTWWVRNTFHPIKLPPEFIRAGSKDEFVEPVAYLKIVLLDKPLEPLPDWGSVSKTEP